MNIQKLTIYSSNITALASFYRDVLGVAIIETSAEKIQLQIGSSILILKYKQKATPYHFAINIPANKVEEALSWLKTKVDILKNNNEEIQPFYNWNARAIYFYDTDRNIVELIARKNLHNSSSKKFDADLFLEISEIGIVTKNIQTIFEQLSENTGISIYFGNYESFCAIGGEHGLFICVNKKYWFPTTDKAYPSDFSVQIAEKGRNHLVTFKDSVLIIE